VPFLFLLLDRQLWQLARLLVPKSLSLTGGYCTFLSLDKYWDCMHSHLMLLQVPILYPLSDRQLWQLARCLCFCHNRMCLCHNRMRLCLTTKPNIVIEYSHRCRFCSCCQTVSCGSLHACL
jgi:hypothetical protein